ncbi:hypothetical protein E0H26_25425 [Micromonospora zingiberis]|uniref:Transcriptional regulator n=1 Tax=Micromonospora zingiberis TaxID=2053011 RepID=A0A4R0G8B4_9ACTN|nr:hypothetical protein [Micromonospora zingiberis]TCB91629.1 hypothetical protein E0H26_25425 [Micromonospora zingiberis]
MGDHDRTEQTLTLLARRGAYEVLLAMHTSGGTASYTRIAAASPRPTTLLRALAAEGFVTIPSGGTLDDEPHGETRFRLTAKGEAIIGHLLRLRQWLASRAPAANHSTIHSTKTGMA